MRAALEVEQEEKKRQENELSLSRKKPEQEAQLEYLRAERQAVEAAAVAKTIAKETWIQVRTPLVTITY